MRFGFINNFAAQIAAPLTDAATEVELSTGADVIATALESTDVIALTLFAVDSQGNETKREVVYATAATPPMVTIERAKEGATASAFTAGDEVEARLTAAQLNNMPQGIVVESSFPGALALGSAYEDGGQSYVGPLASAAGAVAVGTNSEAAGILSVAIGLNSRAYGLKSVALMGGLASGEESQAFGDGSNSQGIQSFALNGGIAIGDGSYAIGDGSQSDGDQSLAILGGYASGLRAMAYGQNAVAGGTDSLALHGSSNGARSIAIGIDSSVSADEGVALGKGAQVNAEGGTAVGRNAVVSSPKSTAYGDGASAQPPGVTALGNGATGLSPEALALGLDAKGLAPYSVAVGRDAEASLVGGLAINAVSYLPAAYRQTGEFAGPPPTATRQAAMQVVIGTVALDLTDGAALATVELPSNAILLPDAFDVVVVESDTPGGAPEIQIGPDDVTPAAYLAATPVTKTAVGGRETHTPLVTDGITALRVAVVTAGTGTAYKIKVVVRGYVMEV
ncbi:hypothetical protein ACIGG6_02365 [Vreelandella lionensis]|uniref:Trimeric autotransporter adhesin YadA-like head domain-containing protein n=1 Tax=Vreelandella lionensis TaxID=1144478 RepID=A0ABW8BQC2_9GAMM